MDTGWTGVSDGETPIPDVWYQGSDQDDALVWFHRGVISKPLLVLANSVLDIARATVPGIEWNIRTRQKSYAVIELRGDVTIQDVVIHCCAELSLFEVDRDAERYVQFFIDKVLTAAMRRYVTEGQEAVRKKE